MPRVASRRGRIASRACDLCRERKIQCHFDENSAACRKCTSINVNCTFLRERRPRGPPARRTTHALNLPIGELSIEHLCPREVFLTIIEDDYLDFVYPVLPLVHRPSFRASLAAQCYTTDAAFFRLCVALCAATVASMPRKFEQYGKSRYSDVGAMVDRACHMVLLSRMTSEPEWQNRPTISTMIVSLLLTMASHYAGRPNQGWSYASEAVQFFRALGLFRKEGYEDLSPLESELCKRAFWLLYIIQIHDRLSFIVPHTGLSFDPLLTDWDFILPLEIEDEDLVHHENSPSPPKDLNASTPHDCQRSLPLISGFTSLIKVFLCVVDLLSSGFPGSPPQAYAMTSGSLRSMVYSQNPIEHRYQSSLTIHASTVSLRSLLRIIKRLQSVLDELPDQLKISTLDPQYRSPNATLTGNDIVSYQFDTMRANIHITSLYIQSTILESCSSAFTRSSVDDLAGSPEDESDISPGQPPRTQLWTFRESIARELLEVLNFCSTKALEANGSSMIVKIREIAATLLSNENELEVESDIEEKSRKYVRYFADILADLDYIGQSTVIPPIFSSHRIVD